MKPRLHFVLPMLLFALPSAVFATDPATNWIKTCSSCHGRDGVGNTRAGRMLRVFNLQEAKVQKGFTDSQAFDAIKNGLVIRGSTKMKPFKDKLSDDEIKALVAYVRTLPKEIQNPGIPRS